MASKTKEKILSTAIALFNEQGVLNVRLQHIADACGISVGNLAYHYPEHKTLVAAVNAVALDELDIDLKSWKKVQGLIDFDNVIIQLHNRIDKYSFLFTDLLELKRNFSKPYRSIHKYQTKLNKAVANCLFSFKENGLIKSDIEEDELLVLTEKFTSFFQHYPRKQSLQDLPTDEIRFRKGLWGLMIPSLSEIGKSEYDILISPIFI